MDALSADPKVADIVCRLVEDLKHNWVQIIEEEIDECGAVNLFELSMDGGCGRGIADRTRWNSALKGDPPEGQNRH